MVFYYAEVVQWNLRVARGRYMRQSFLLLVTLSSWMTSTAAQASAATTAPPCGGTLTDSGVIQSPNYPMNYPNLARCSWTLSSRSNNTGIRIQFNTFALEQRFDYIIIYNELNSKMYTGRNNPPTTLVGKGARIAFYSDISQTMKGFSATFSSVDVTSRYQCLTNDTFWCNVCKKCISSNWLCDGYPDCTYNEDESSCASTTTKTASTTKSTTLQQECAQNQRFWCGTSRQCINSYQRCNQVNDCLHGEDEDGCLSTEARAAIIVGSLCVAVLAVLRGVGRWRAETRAFNHCIQTIKHHSATMWSKETTYVSQFGAPNRQAGGPQGASGQPLDQYAPPTYDATVKAYASGEYSHPSAQSGELRPFLNTPAITSPSTN